METLTSVPLSIRSHSSWVGWSHVSGTEGHGSKSEIPCMLQSAENPLLGPMSHQERAGNTKGSFFGSDFWTCAVGEQGGRDYPGQGTTLVKGLPWTAAIPEFWLSCRGHVQTVTLDLEIIPGWRHSWGSLQGRGPLFSSLSSESRGRGEWVQAAHCILFILYFKHMPVGLSRSRPIASLWRCVHEGA